MKKAVVYYSMSGNTKYVAQKIAEKVIHHLAQQIADRRHHDIRHQRIRDLAERAADDDADRHVDDVALDRKFLEFAHDAHVCVLSVG